MQDSHIRVGNICIMYEHYLIVLGNSHWACSWINRRMFQSLLLCLFRPSSSAPPSPCYPIPASIYPQPLFQDDESEIATKQNIIMTKDKLRGGNNYTETKWIISYKWRWIDRLGRGVESLIIHWWWWSSDYVNISKFLIMLFRSDVRVKRICTIHLSCIYYIYS